MCEWIHQWALTVLQVSQMQQSLKMVTIANAIKVWLSQMQYVLDCLSIEFVLNVCIEFYTSCLHWILDSMFVLNFVLNVWIESYAQCIEF